MQNDIYWMEATLRKRNTVFLKIKYVSKSEYMCFSFFPFLSGSGIYILKWLLIFLWKSVRNTP